MRSEILKAIYFLNMSSVLTSCKESDKISSKLHLKSKLLIESGNRDISKIQISRSKLWDKISTHFQTDIS